MFRTAKNSLIYYATRVAVALVGLTPRRLVPFFGNLIGRLAYRVARLEARLASEQLASALELSDRSRRLGTLTRGVFIELGKSAVELARILRSPGRAPRVTLSAESKEALDRALDRGKGVVFVTGHIGNWELMAITLARLGYPISTVARTSYDSRFTRWIERSRARFGVEVIYRHNRGAAAAMLRALGKGRILGFLIDQDTDVPSLFVPFFHDLASTPIGAGVFAMRTGSPVVLGSIRRSPRGEHRIEIEEIPLPESIEAATRQMTHRLEQRIRRHPSQWVWFHRRWKTRPNREVA